MAETVLFLVAYLLILALISGVTFKYDAFAFLIDSLTSLLAYNIDVNGINLLREP